MHNTDTKYHTYNVHEYVISHHSYIIRMCVQEGMQGLLHLLCFLEGSLEGTHVYIMWEL